MIILPPSPPPLHPITTNPPEGPFQSDALLVPEHCLFDHIHNQTKCWNFDQWNGTAGHACADRSMRLRSFAMLLPCGIDVFSGVEFVCCPAKKARKGRETKAGAAALACHIHAICYMFAFYLIFVFIRDSMYIYIFFFYFSILLLNHSF